MNKLLIGAAALLLAACGQDTTTEPTETPTAAPPAALESGIDLSAMDTTVRPGDDFFEFVNGQWVERTEMPADRSRYGTFDILRDESQEAVKAIIEESAEGDFPKGSDEQKVGDLGGVVDFNNQSRVRSVVRVAQPQRAEQLYR